MRLIYLIPGLVSVSIGGALVILTRSFWIPLIATVAVDLLLIAVLVKLWYNWS
jgi:hypothetical protein